jgi:hypothetical protein
MALSPISSRPVPVVQPVPPAVARSGRVARAASPGDGPRRAPAPPAETVGVQFAHRADGVQVVAFVDLRTGVVICQTPPQAVLEVVDSIVQAIEQRERADGE